MLDAEGAPAPRKHGWSPNALQLILANPAYRDLIRWNGDTHPGLHEPLVDEDTFEKAQAILTRRGENASLRRGNPSEFLLSGLVRCHHCGRAYVGTSAHGRSSRYTYYACSTRYKYGPAKCNGDRLPKDRLGPGAARRSLSRWTPDRTRAGGRRQAHPEPATPARRTTRRCPSRDRAAGAETGALLRSLRRRAALGRTLPRPRPRPPQPARNPPRARSRTDPRLGTQAHTPPDGAALAGLADELEEILASESPEKAKELLRLLVKEIHVHDRRRIVPTYRVPAGGSRNTS